jgi:hypothetical protein
MATGGREPLNQLARTVRTTGNPNPADRFNSNMRVQVQLKPMSAFLREWLAPERATAIAFEPRPTSASPEEKELAKQAELPPTSRVSLTAGAAPGRDAVRALVDPPGLDKAARHRLPNGLEVVLLPYGRDTVASATLYLPNDEFSVEQALRAGQVLQSLRNDLPDPACGLVRPRATAAGVELRFDTPAHGPRLSIELLACWTVDRASRIKDLDGNQEARKFLREFDRAMRGGAPTRLDDAPGWAARWYRATFRPERATLVVTGLYVALNWTFLRTVPVPRLAGVVEVGALSAKELFGPAGGRIMSGLFALLLVATVSAMVLAGSRVTEAVARDLASVSRLGARSASGVPRNAILLQVGVTLLLLLTNSVERVMTYAGFTLNLASLATVLAVFRLRRREPGLPRPYRTWGYPVTPIFFVLASLWTLGFVLAERPVASLAGLATLALGAALWWWDQRAGRSGAGGAA